MRLLYFVLLFSFSVSLSAQYTDHGPANHFRSEANPHYWKNKLPFAGYWQQDVHYTIKASVDETTDIVTGEEELTYYNNSPDTLRYAYFHLYQNAFQPGSYLDDLQCHNDVHVRYGKYESAMQGIAIEKMFSDGNELTTQLDNTILKVLLDKPLLPGASKTFSIRFRTFFDSGSTRRRLKLYKSFGTKHYNGCQWYPKICAYDRKSGWNTDQHLNREFYGNFGTFDVELTFASNFLLEATGVLQNESEVLPDTLKQKLDIRNFATKKWDSKPSVITPYNKDERKTWKYHAENVHDFAFTADPTYRIHDTIIYPGRANGDGVRCVSIVQEPHASGWVNAHTYLAKIISVFSRDFGVFEYPKIVVADAQDGMEYPMLTLDGGREPENYGLLVHEVGHNWFYGMVGSNETYRAMMDEGFTQFLTAWGMEAINGDTLVHDTIKNRYVRKHFEPVDVRDNKSYLSYLTDATLHNDEPLNTHSDGFNGALGQGGGYRHVYSKTSTMLYNLQYVLGDSLFLAAMKNYVAQWKFAHPYPEDFRNSVSRFTHADLNWFFDQWMETTKNIDYKIVSVKRGEATGEYRIKLRRKGRMQMPIDLRVIDKQGKAHDFYIPNTWFQKTDSAVHLSPLTSHPTTLPKWYGWDKLRPTYTAVVNIPAGVKNVIIDPSERLADINMFNNRLRGNTEVRFDSRIYPQTSWKKYRIYMRPDLWYNALDGFKIGFNMYGSYMNVKHKFNFTMWFNTRLVQHSGNKFEGVNGRKEAGIVSYRLDYSTPLDGLFKRTTFSFHSRWLDGCEMYRVGLSKWFPKNFTAEIFIKAFTRNKESWRGYLLYPNEWSTIWRNPGNRFNTSLNLALTYRYNHEKFNGFLTANLRSSALASSFNYHYFDLTSVLKTSFWRFDLRTRVYGRIGTGNDLPSESALYFAGGNPEEMMDSKYYRAEIYWPYSWRTYNADIGHLHFGGGLNMRGYAGYLLAETDKHGVVLPAYKGASGVGANIELDFNRIVKVKSAWLRERFALNTYLFGDFGSIGYTNSAGKQQMSQLRADAGAGVALTIKKWWVLQGIHPLTLRFDVPFFISHAPYVSQKHFAFRWVVGISRAF